MGDLLAGSSQLQDQISLNGLWKCSVKTKKNVKYFWIFDDLLEQTKSNERRDYFCVCQKQTGLACGVQGLFKC